MQHALLLCRCLPCWMLLTPDMLAAMVPACFGCRTGEADIVMHLTPEQQADEQALRDKETGAELEVVNKVTLLPVCGASGIYGREPA